MEEYNTINIWQKIQTTSRCRSKNLNLNAMRHYDHTVNITWVMQHLNTAKKYIEQSGKDDGEATGGSDWKIHASKISEENFFPELWSKHELKTGSRNVG
jgi:tryptophan 2,3-dioxygenase